jgi:hypothetical protein
LKWTCVGSLCLAADASLLVLLLVLLLAALFR